AHYLRGQGAGPEAVVGICLERGVELVVSLLGVLKAGAAYLPLDPAYPAQRLEFMMKDSGMKLLLTRKGMIKAVLPEGARAIDLNAECESISGGSGDNPARQAVAENLAYTIYTSGSTGTPKGVAIRHASLTVFLLWARSFFSDEELARVLASTSICFDISVIEIFFPLAFGGKVIVVENALDLSQGQDVHGVTYLNVVSSAARELLELDAVPASVRTVGFAGEAVPSDLATKICELPFIKRVCDLYGPTEDTVYSTVSELHEDGDITIGRPIWQTRAYILGKDFELCPVGVLGELMLAGDGQARGYVGRGDLTAGKFIPNPYGVAAGERMYRTGDIAKWRDDGKIEYLGRGDDQIKLRGYLIELAEVEGALRQWPGIRQAAVVLKQDASAGKHLVAYVTADEPIDASQIRSHLRQTLPEYMVPALIVQLPQMPLTANGKLDRKSLPDVEIESGQQYQAPGNETERELVRIWEEVLKRERIGVVDDFFDLGGHSLLATQVISKLRKRMGFDVPLQELFKASTVKEFARIVDNIRHNGGGASMPAMRRMARRAPQGADATIVPESDQG
ncbi:MAG TPA: non-ribosomal peptide synthetase, partial [Blastocatellia bacterium]|nr:non-ribosomal peptide synthetase [Blastocatellia bacterium]